MQKPPVLSGGFWSGLRDSNPRPSPWQGDALPTELNPLEPVFLTSFHSLPWQVRRRRIPTELNPLNSAGKGYKALPLRSRMKAQPSRGTRRATPVSCAACITALATANTTFGSNTLGMMYSGWRDSLGMTPAIARAAASFIAPLISRA